MVIGSEILKESAKSGWNHEKTIKVGLAHQIDRTNMLERFLAVRQFENRADNSTASTFM